MAEKEKIMLDVWAVLKRKTEVYMENIYMYFKCENMLDAFYLVFTPNVCCFKRFNVEAAGECRRSLKYV